MSSIKPSIAPQPATIQQVMDPEQVYHHQRLADLGAFSAMMVHELRNPLTTLMMALEHFQSLELQPSSQERLDLAVSEVDRLRELLNSILNYSKYQSLNRQRLELNDFVQTVLDEWDVTPAAAARKLSFTRAGENLTVLIDPAKFKQVLINLVRNAVEATQPGESICCTVFKTDARAYIQIQNPAPLIPQSEIEKLANPFFSTKQSGTGLGLAIVKQLVEAHQGDFVVESDVQNGVCVCIGLSFEAAF
ncbi:MAG: HAMP domain-containing sensor histidine kinase [Cyanobacteria bacterium P01_A01_bin.17]